jgi:uncharacterized protein YjbI with pentapeptide repeats
VFLGQLLQQSDMTVAMTNFADCMESSTGNSALIGFRYIMLAREFGFSIPQVNKLDLSGASLYRWQIKDVHMRNFDFSSANLAETRWDNVNLLGGSMADAFITQSRWTNCQLTKIDTTALQSSGAYFKYCQYRQMQVPKRGVWYVTSEGDDVTSNDISAPLLKELQEGHQDEIWGVMVDAERGRYVSASSDKRLKVWDAKSLQCVATLEGHQGGIWGVTVDAERGRYTSALDDQTLKVWNAESLQCIATCFQLPDFEWTAIQNEDLDSVQLSSHAAAHLKWVGRNSVTGKLVAAPFEGLVR